MKYLHPTPTDSPRDPLRWPFWLRCIAVVVTSLANFVGNMAGAGISVAIPVLMQEFHKSQSDATQVLTVRAPRFLVNDVNVSLCIC